MAEAIGKFLRAVLLIGILFGVGYCMLQSPTQTTSRPASPVGTKMGSMKDTSPACKTSDDVQKFHDILVTEELEAANRFLQSRGDRGECIVLKKGDEVFPEKNPVFSDFMCVRPKGEFNCWWINKGHFSG
jgi:hypothetical protein